LNDGVKKTDLYRRSFREVFAKLDDHTLITGSEFAELLCVSPGAVMKMVLREQLPAPLIRKNKVTRWSVLQARNFLSGLVENPVARPHVGCKGKGRPRLETEGGAV
jgi:hypothetical protein